MERYYRPSYRGVEQTKTASVYSTDSTKKSMHSDYSESTESTHSRPQPTKPSYMNASVPARKPVVPKPSPTSPKTRTDQTTPSESPSTAPIPPTPAAPVKGTLLVAIAAAPHKSTITFVERMLKKGSYSTVMLLGSKEQEAVLKQVKMDTYALLGKLSQECSVLMELQDNWQEEDISAAVTKVVERSDAIHGVLCQPALERGKFTSEDILELNDDQLQSPWRSSVGFLHSVAKAAIPKFRSDHHMQSRSFLVIIPKESLSVLALHQVACAALILQLADPKVSRGLVVDYAENVLLPEPEPVNGNGNSHPRLSAPERPSDGDDDYPPPESPTKLWNLWALQDGLGAD